MNLKSIVHFIENELNIFKNQDEIKVFVQFISMLVEISDNQVKSYSPQEKENIIWKIKEQFSKIPLLAE